MKLHLTKKGRKMFNKNEDLIPIHWFALTDKQKAILDCLYNHGDINTVWDETALQLLMDVKLIKYN